MAEVPFRTSEPHKPRLVIYHQTHHIGPQGDQTPVSLLPLLTNNTGVTHIIIAAVHLNEGNILTLNDDPDTSPKFNQLWDEVAIAQAAGVKVLAMLGGAAKGSYERLSGSEESFTAALGPVLSFLRLHSLDGIDLDVEEPLPLPNMIRLIDALVASFPPSFLITLAPVFPALLPNQPHLSGFSYFALEAARSASIAWYNVQFYCGWGDASTPEHYMWAVRSGWDPRRCVLGTVSCAENGSGWVDMVRLGEVVAQLRRMTWRGDGEGFGGVACWEYFNAEPGGRERPWEWAGAVGGVLAAEVERGGPEPGPGDQRPGPDQVVVVAQSPFPAESLRTLEELGFSRMQAVAALNRTGGNVEFAAGLLFDM
ncbi:hypothetical protein CAC42_515 [Sphaceloma murrayae]|uniref:Uncharacterized protein n=1 Tax=Sphaceloma murrayae TaxID=2082308 RepID=A0A2K1R3R8_9PEZI|nr:hypothetical protein CAC42_515 [Sphaceloma murrayae]